MTIDTGLKTQRGVRNPRNPIVMQLGADGFEDAVEIGRGGFGVVYRCTQVELDRVVAVKVLTVHLDENRPRFQREQRAMARLTGQPNIVAVLQVGESHDGHPYLVMPYCRGGCIQTEITKLGRLPLEDALRVGVKISAALESAHRLEIVHRDVKPSNVLLTEYGEPVLTDFGVAHIAGGFTTGTGVLTGSPGFTAPEVIRGDAPDRASDVYGLAATLFCALSGHPPFERRGGESVTAQLARIGVEPIPDLREHGVPVDVADVIDKALSRDPRDRPAMVELGEALQNLEADHGLAIDEMALQDATGTGERAQRSVPSTSVGRARGNLPAPLASFVGRAAEIAELCALLRSSRLVTLAGVGGVGKTTLAVHAARNQVPHFDDGVWLVELGELSDGSLLTGVAASALGIRDQIARPLADVMVETLAERNALVVFDNCEQVIDDAASLIATLLAGCPQLRIVATSREVLGITGETVLPLSPLPYPDTDSIPSRAKLARYDAVALFVERARTAEPSFTLTQDNAAAVARICAQLDGLPLAIELAAARLRAMSVDQIADRLSDRFKLLTRGRRGAPTRQQTLSWCIGWSYDRCTPREQRLWARLSVFAGSFELGAAREVCAQGISEMSNMSREDLIDELCALVDKSILIRNEDDGVVRFRLLATLREYGKMHISDADEYPLLQRRHLGWYQQLLRDAFDQNYSKHQVRWHRCLRREMSNLQEALQFGLEDAPTVALEMAGNMRHIWATTGMLEEGRRWLERALDATPAEPTPERMKAVAAVAMFADLQFDWPTAARRVNEARALLEVVPDPVTSGLIDWSEGFGALLRGEIDQAQACAERALAGTQDFEVHNLSMTLMVLRFLIAGDAESALRWSEKALELSESRRETVARSYMLGCVGVSRFALGDLELAESVLSEGLRVCRLIDYSWTGAQILEILAWVAAAKDDPLRAVVLMAASTSVSQASGTSSTTIGIAGLFHEQCHGQVRQQLPPIEFETASIEGGSLTFDEAAAFALGEYF